MPRHWEAGYTGPLPGNQMEFVTPFAKKGMEGSNTPESRVVAYCNEAVGFGLGWQLAPARIGIFGEQNGTPPANPTGNIGRRFSKRANKGANQYKFLLIPGTGIEVSFNDPNTFGMRKASFIRKSISVSFDRTISVTEMKLWACGAAVDITKTILVPKIYAVVTPSLKVHPIRSKGDPNKVIYISAEMKAAATELGIQQINFSG